MRRWRLLSPMLLLSVACGDDGGNASSATGTGTSSSTTTSDSSSEGPSTSTTSELDSTGSSTGGTGGTTETTTDSSESSGTGGSDSTETTDATGTTGEPLTCTVFVDAATGSDASSGDSWAMAKATVTAGLDTAAMAGEPCDVWVAEGTYYPSEIDDPTQTFSLLPNSGLYGGFAGDESSIDERDIAAHETILSGDLGVMGDPTDNSHHVVTPANNSRLDGFTVTGGYAVGMQPPFGGSGGGIYNAGFASFTVAHCHVTGNQTAAGDEFGGQPGWGGDGGGLYSNGGSVTILDSRFDDNHAADGGTNGVNGAFGGNGGGAYITGPDVIIERSEFFGNTAGDGGFGTTLNGGGIGGNGGALHVTGALVVHIVDSRFENNETGQGGFPGDPVFFQGGGGALFLFSGDGAGIVMLNSTFRNNVANAGAAVFTNTASGDLPGSMMLANTMFSQNTATVIGGGLFYSGDGDYALDLAHCVFEGNSAGLDAGGLFYRNDTQGGMAPAAMVGSILWNNAAMGTPQLVTATSGGGPLPLSVDVSDIQGGCPVQPNLACGTVLDTDPLFVDAALGDLHLMPGSPVEDQADMALLPADVLDLDDDLDTAELLPVDADGNDRVQGLDADMGAFELP